MKRLFLILIALLSLLSAFAYGYEGGDTGTYRILDYRVMLTPGSDGTVTIEYYQKWQVTGGHIPWITVGTPDAEFTIANYSGAVRSASDASADGWSGVRLDLDNDYQAGKTFEVRFAIIEDRLVSADGTKNYLSFTPGWYDRALIDSLQVRIKCPVKPELVQASPAPTSKENGCLTWRRKNLSEGELLPITISFPMGTISGAIPQEDMGQGSQNSQGGSDDDTSCLMWLAIIVGGIILAGVILRRVFKLDDGGYSGGNIYHGGTGGYGGCVHSCACACACAGCACACACAGGGGAGCSRKMRHTCPSCEEKRRAGLIS
jgi:hypothetical protein